MNLITALKEGRRLKRRLILNGCCLSLEDMSYGRFTIEEVESEDWHLEDPHAVVYRTAVIKACAETFTSRSSPSMAAYEEIADKLGLQEMS